MTSIFVTGNSKDKEIEKLIKNRLSNNYNITYIRHKRVQSLGSGYNLIVFDSDKPEIKVSGSILLMKEKGTVPENLPSDITAIINTDCEEQLKTIQKQKIRVIACGFGATSTISFSGETEDMLTVSLNRSITALSGKNIEPLEFPLKKNDFSHYSLMSFAALRLLLDDFDSELGKLM